MSPRSDAEVTTPRSARQLIDIDESSSSSNSSDEDDASPGTPSGRTSGSTPSSSFRVGLGGGSRDKHLTLALFFQPPLNRLASANALTMGSRSNRNSAAYSGESVGWFVVFFPFFFPLMFVLIAMTAVSKAVVTTTSMVDLDPHLGDGGDGDEADAPAQPIVTARSGERPVYFLAAMDEWMRNLKGTTDDTSLGALLKYWDQWRFPNKVTLPCGFCDAC